VLKGPHNRAVIEASPRQYYLGGSAEGGAQKQGAVDVSISGSHLRGEFY